MNEDITHIPINELIKLKLERLCELVENAAGELEAAKRKKQWLESAVALKYEEITRARRQQVGKDTGLIHIETEGFKLSNDIPQKIEWDQKKLAEIAAKIMTSGGALSDYIEVYYSIPETKYNSWSEAMRSMFDPARTIKIGKASYKLSRIETHMINEVWL